ncbi:DegT/DnrJ/EryC1/StrS family aminotransferase [Crocinitomicaceae bacterium]|nr:DegT/DnrJ/EryC1/StrS family aminotransferase [Crocinitomicaceae bacterium]
MKWIAKKNIDNSIVNNLMTIPLKTNQFTNGGTNVKKLEEFIMNRFKIDENKCVIVVTNGSVALHALTSGIEYYEKTQINWATQAFTFPPSAQSNLSTVKIIDIDKDGGLDLEQVDNTIGGLIVTNIFGNVVEIDKYEKFCRENNKFLIFDNAATGYTEYNGKNCLNYGNGCTISFHHTKPFGFGEGGAIIVDKKYEKSIRCLNNFGIGLTDKYWVPEGNNNKMSEISAVYILQYLERNIDKIINTHNELYLYFKEHMKNITTHFKLFPSFHDRIIVPSCFCILFDKYDDKIRERLLENNIQARKYYHPLNDSKVANEIFDKILCIPCNIDMDRSDIDNIFYLFSSNVKSYIE